MKCHHQIAKVRMEMTQPPHYYASYKPHPFNEKNTHIEKCRPKDNFKVHVLCWIVMEYRYTHASCMQNVDNTDNNTQAE